MQKKVSAVIVLVLAIAAIAYLQSQHQKSPETVEQSNSSLNQEADKSDSNSNSEASTNSAEWKDYTSSVFGISLQYPETVKRPKQEEHTGKAYLKVIEDQKNNSIYITSKDTDSLESLQKETKNALDGDGKLIQNAKPSNGWEIKFSSAKNESELNKFIQDTYGKGCSLKTKTEGKQKGVYEIALNTGEDKNGNGTSMDEAVCPVNYIYRILYYPETNKIASISIGQDCTFYDLEEETSDPVCYDEKILDTIKFN